MAVAVPPGDALDAGGIQLPVWTRVLGWCGTAGLIYLLIVFAAFAVVGQDAKIRLQAAFVHLLYNVFAIIAIYVIPALRPVPLFCAQTLARIAVQRRWVLAAYLITVFIALPALVIILVGVL
jgi:hypothetical protein